MMNIHGIILTAVLGFPLVATAGQTREGTILDRVGFDQKLNGHVPIDLVFKDERGTPVALRDFFGKPVILNLVYYQCPTLCSQTLNGLTRSMKPLSLRPGVDFNVITLSIDPTESPDLARRKRAAYLKRLDRPGAERGWHFFTGDEPSIRKLADSVGFRYSYNARNKQYVHAAGIVILTPKGDVARYLYGIDFPPKDLQFALTEASTGRIGSPIARVLLLCYDYDAATGRYTLAIVRLTRILSVGMALVVAAFLVVMFRRERRQARSGVIDDTAAHAASFSSR